jgi:hypothetical protein
MKNLENSEVIMFGRPLSEIPPNPPLKKGGRGDFWPEPWSEGKSWFPVASLPIYEALLKSDRSRTFRTKSKIEDLRLECRILGEILKTPLREERLQGRDSKSLRWGGPRGKISLIHAEKYRRIQLIILDLQRPTRQSPKVIPGDPAIDFRRKEPIFRPTPIRQGKFWQAGKIRKPAGKTEKNQWPPPPTQGQIGQARRIIHSLHCSRVSPLRIAHCGKK